MFFEPNRRTTPWGFFVPSWTVAPRDDHPLDLLGRAELAERPHDIPPLPLPDVAPGGVLILVGQGRPQVVDREPAGGQPLGIDDHLQLVLPPADEVGPRDAVDPLEPGFDLVFGKPLDSLDIDDRRHEAGELRVFGDELPEPVEPEVGRAGRGDPVEGRRQLGMVGLRSLEGGQLRRGLAKDQPGDRPVVGAGGLDHRPVGVDRPVADLLDAGVDLDERLRHVGADGKLHLDRAGRVARLAGELDEPFDAAELFLERLDELLLDFLGARPQPPRLDGDRRNLDLRRQLHRHREDRQRAEQGHQQDPDGRLDGIRDAGGDQVHGVGWNETAIPGRSRSLPLVTTNCPGSRPPRISTWPSTAAPSETSTGRTVPVLPPGSAGSIR
jgi:hypothetical protein